VCHRSQCRPGEEAVVEAAVPDLDLMEAMVVAGVVSVEEQFL